MLDNIRNENDHNANQGCDNESINGDHETDSRNNSTAPEDDATDTNESIEAVSDDSLDEKFINAEEATNLTCCSFSRKQKLDLMPNYGEFYRIEFRRHNNVYLFLSFFIIDSDTT